MKVDYRWLAAGLVLVLGLSIANWFWWSSRSVGMPETVSLRLFVTQAPPVPVVFTSRTEPSSFQAAAPEGEGFAFPGTIPWAATEGRLRLLTPSGRVHELTWGNPLADGASLIDVMSPSVTADGQAVLFAGRKAAPDPGRWRIYRIRLCSNTIEPITGGPDDAGCVADPPMRFAVDGSVLASRDRRALDYDDVDPVDDGAGGIVFASSRIPDLGRDHSRRATQVWHKPQGGAPRPLSANRNNDRWPFVASGNIVLFSTWSRNREAVSADGADVHPVSEGGTFATSPTDSWYAARVFLDGTQFGYAVKTAGPVWRPRPLFNGKVVFATSNINGRQGLAQADWGYLRSAPSSLAIGASLPTQVGGELLAGPGVDGNGNPIHAATPSPCPGGKVLFAAGSITGGPAEIGLMIVDDDWHGASKATPLFDDPDFVDAEPVAVYRRGALPASSWVPPTAIGKPARLTLASGATYQGPAGQIDNYIINAEMPDPFPGQKTDPDIGPAMPYPTGVRSIAVYAAHRDRFDDPQAPRLNGKWEKLLDSPLDGRGALRAWVPADPLMPTVLAGLDGAGKIFNWSGNEGPAGKRATFYALAGDHYSGTRADGYHFCVGCHTGHTHIKVDITERIR